MRTLGVHVSLLLVSIIAVGCQSRSIPKNEATTRQNQDRAERERPGERDAGSALERDGLRRPPRARPSQSTEPGRFDYYLLTLSWSPEFCRLHPSSEECPSHPGFVVHGLWPQNDDGTYPEHCSDQPGPSDPKQYTNLIPTVGLVEHEWKAHGTCSGLGATEYFNQIGKAFHEVQLPPGLVNATEETTSTPKAILGQFAAANPGFPTASFALSCGHNDLTAVEICLSKSLVPQACHAVRSCGATTITIAPR